MTITIYWMGVKTSPFRVRSDSLSVHTEANHQSEAGSRAQSELKQFSTLVLMGRYYGELKRNT
jgi:hypothetical protein